MTVRRFAPVLAILSVLIGPFLLAESGGWNGQRSFSNELGSTLGISALGVLAIVLILPTANRSAADITFAGELDALRDRLDLHVVHVLSRPPESWTGERGRLTAGILDRYLPDDLSRWDFFLCCAAAAVESGIAAFAENGIPPERVHAERFVAV